MRELPPDPHDSTEEKPRIDGRNKEGLMIPPHPDSLHPRASAESGKETPQLICGVDRRQIEAFLTLIRDYYKKADKATFFLEQRTGIVNIQGITNVRDVLSHLVTLLSPDTPEEDRAEQLGNAEEHLRRAIMEPYEIALNDLTVKFSELYKNYKERVLPIKDKHTVLRNAPNAVSVEATLGVIREMTSQGRAGKAKNLWNPEWEAAVASFIGAFDKLTILYNELEVHWNNYEQIQRDRKATALAVISISIGMIGVIIAILTIFLPAIALKIRSMLGLG